MRAKKVCIYCKRLGSAGYERDPYDEAWQCSSVSACGRRTRRASRHIFG